MDDYSLLLVVDFVGIAGLMGILLWSAIAPQSFFKQTWRRS